MICRWVEDPNSEAFKLHIERVYDFLWVAEDGMKMKVSTSSYALLLAFNRGGCSNNEKTSLSKISFCLLSFYCRSFVVIQWQPVVGYGFNSPGYFCYWPHRRVWPHN